MTGVTPLARSVPILSLTHYRFRILQGPVKRAAELMDLPAGHTRPSLGALR